MGNASKNTTAYCCPYALSSYEESDATASAHLPAASIDGHDFTPCYQFSFKLVRNTSQFSHATFARSPLQSYSSVLSHFLYTSRTFPVSYHQSFNEGNKDRQWQQHTCVDKNMPVHTHIYTLTLTKRNLARIHANT